MNNNLKSIAARYASALKVAEVFTTDDRPTHNDIWLWKLENAVCRNVQYPRQAVPGNEYSQFTLYAHGACLKSDEDVRNAPDVVLLESLGLAPLAFDDSGQSAWLKFMVREAPWFHLIAANWGLPAMRCEFGGHAGATVESSFDERLAQNTLYYLGLMNERGIDPLARAREVARLFKARSQQKSGVEISEAKFLEWAKKNNEYLYNIYACGSVEIRPEAVGEDTVVAYSGDHRRKYRAEIREASERRRQNWKRERTCDCSLEWVIF